MQSDEVSTEHMCQHEENGPIASVVHSSRVCVCVFCYLHIPMASLQVKTNEVSTEQESTSGNAKPCSLLQIETAPWVALFFGTH